MKTSLLLAILVLSINTVAQNYYPASAPMAQAIEMKSSADLHARIIQQGKIPVHNPGNQMELNGSLVQVFDSIYHWNCSDPDVGLRLNYKITDMVYDGNNNLVSKLMLQWNGNDWVNYYQYSYLYNASNHLTSEVFQSWTGSAWEFDRQYIYGYDANDNLTTEMHQQWNINSWKNENFTTYTYDTRGNLTSELFQNWTASTWKNVSKEIYTYDASNNQVGKLYQYWNGSAWFDDARFVNSFDEDNNLTNALYQVWSGSAWEDRSNYDYTYDVNNNRINEYRTKWISGNWENFSLRTYNYDFNNNQTSDRLQNWNGSTWVDSEQSRFYFDADNFMNCYSYKFCNLAGTQILGGDSTHYYFHKALGINDLTSPGNTSVYPSPCNGKFTLHGSGTMNKIEIYSLSGELVYAENDLQNQNPVEIDITSHAKGIYIIRITTGSKICTGKIISQ